METKETHIVSLFLIFCTDVLFNRRTWIKGGIDNQSESQVNFLNGEINTITAVFSFSLPVDGSLQTDKWNKTLLLLLTLFCSVYLCTLNKHKYLWRNRVLSHSHKCMLIAVTIEWGAMNVHEWGHLVRTIQWSFTVRDLVTYWIV